MKYYGLQTQFRGRWLTDDETKEIILRESKDLMELQKIKNCSLIPFLEIAPYGDYKCNYCNDTKEVAVSSTNYINCPNCVTEKIND